MLANTGTVGSRAARFFFMHFAVLGKMREWFAPAR
jgi:hypothetical protein